jgi:hypothetical protein
MDMDEQDQEQTTARKGFAPVTVGQDVHIEKGGGAVLFARRDMHLSRGGGQWLVALGNQTITQGGGAVLVSREARVSQGFVGLIVAGRVTLEGTARALVTVSVPLLAAAAAGFGLGVLIGRRRRA